MAKDDVLSDLQTVVIGGVDPATGKAQMAVVDASGHLVTVAGDSSGASRENTEATLLASAARTADTASPDQTNLSGRGCHVLVNVTAGSGFSITPKIQGKGPISGAYYDIVPGQAITTTGLNLLKVAPGIGQVPGLAAADVLPRTWRVNVVHGNANSVTYSVAAVVVL